MYTDFIKTQENEVNGMQELEQLRADNTEYGEYVGELENNNKELVDIL